MLLEHVFELVDLGGDLEAVAAGDFELVDDLVAGGAGDFLRFVLQPLDGGLYGLWEGWVYEDVSPDGGMWVGWLIG